MVVCSHSGDKSFIDIQIFACKVSVGKKKLNCLLHISSKGVEKMNNIGLNQYGSF